MHVDVSLTGDHLIAHAGSTIIADACPHTTLVICQQIIHHIHYLVNILNYCTMVDKYIKLVYYSWL